MQALRIGMLATIVVLACGAAQGQQNATAKERQPMQTGVEIEHTTLKPMEGQVLTFHSPLYGDLQSFALCVTDLSPEPKPLLIDLIPGTLSRLDRAAKDCEQTCQIAAEDGL